jgi:LAO/AO transport system kinase
MAAKPFYVLNLNANNRYLPQVRRAFIDSLTYLCIMASEAPLKNNIRSGRSLPNVDVLVQGICAGNRVLLGQAITLVESARSEHQAMAREVIAQLLSRTDRPENTFRIGITGVPGVGKSTLIERLGMALIQQGKKVAVLAIDPSSAISKGSIMGDKTRMERLSASEQAFIRPSPSGDSLGGVARKTRETILLVEAAGYDTVFIETVGVGQSEIAVHSMTDVFMLLLLPGAGDELQGIKRGIVEMADLLVVNKADHDRVQMANQARAHYINATHLLPVREHGWAPAVLTCSAETGAGIEQVLEKLEAYRQHIVANGFWMEQRRQQAAYWLRETLQQQMMAAFYGNEAVRNALEKLEPQVKEGRMSPFAAAMEILQLWQ